TLPLAEATGARHGSLVIELGEETYLLGSRPIDPDGWRLISALPLEPAEREASLIGVLGALATLLGVGALLLARQRRQIVRLKLDQTALLEKRVAERTGELAHEVEERRRAEAELRSTQENLIHTAKLAALGRMSAAIVHEVSQPLSALDTTLAAADRHAERQATADVRHNLGNARALLRRMQRTVKHLRSFSSRRDPGPPEAVGIAGVLEAAIEIVAPQARDTGIDIALAIPEPLPHVRGNALRLEQVFINLLLNAIDATRAAGETGIRITAEAEPEGLCVTIADPGPGIPDAVRDRLFEPFFTTKTTGESLGLGLSISRSLLEEFGGSLSLDPGPGGGTRATVRLPLAPAPARPVLAEEPA
ncbi:MAG: sensor histidine kinase, partial [Devosia sp.]